MADLAAWVEANHRELLRAAADLPLTEDERRLLRWIARFDEVTREALAGLLRRLRQAERRATPMT